MPTKGQFKYSEKDALARIKEFYIKHNRFPNKKEYNSNNNLPSKNYYFEHFDSMLSIAELCDIKLSEDEIKLYSKRKQTNEELLLKVNEYTQEFIKNNNHLPRKIDLNNVIPSAILDRRFKTMENMYSLIDIDYKKINENLLQKDMINKFVQLSELLGHTPNSREIDKYSKLEGYYAMKTYSEHFGSLYELQQLCNLNPTRMGINRNKEEMLEDLRYLINNIEHLPNSRDIESCKECCCLSQYVKVFGSLDNALLKLGYKKKDILHKVYITKNGVKCKSSYEYKFATMLEKYNIKYENEVLYKSAIQDFNRQYKFDFVFHLFENIYYVEIFGIEGNDKYNKRKIEKINICKSNNIKLIDLYREDIIGGGYEYLYNLILDKITKQEVA